MRKIAIITIILLLFNLNIFSINPNTLNVSYTKDGFSIGIAEFNKDIYFSSDLKIPIANKGNGYLNITLGHPIINDKFYLGGIVGLYSFEPNVENRNSVNFNFGGEIGYCHNKDVISSLFVTNNSCVGLKIGVMF